MESGTRKKFINFFDALINKYHTDGRTDTYDRDIELLKSFYQPDEIIVDEMQNKYVLTTSIFIKNANGLKVKFEKSLDENNQFTGYYMTLSSGLIDYQNINLFKEIEIGRRRKNKNYINALVQEYIDEAYYYTMQLQDKYSEFIMNKSERLQFQYIKEHDNEENEDMMYKFAITYINTDTEESRNIDKETAIHYIQNKYNFSQKIALYLNKLAHIDFENGYWTIHEKYDEGNDVTINGAELLLALVENNCDNRVLYREAIKEMINQADLSSKIPENLESYYLNDDSDKEITDFWTSFTKIKEFVDNLNSKEASKWFKDVTQNEYAIDTDLRVVNIINSHLDKNFIKKHFLREFWQFKSESSIRTHILDYTEKDVLRLYNNAYVPWRNADAFIYAPYMIKNYMIPATKELAEHYSRLIYIATFIANKNLHASELETFKEFNQCYNNLKKGDYTPYNIKKMMDIIEELNEKLTKVFNYETQWYEENIENIIEPYNNNVRLIIECEKKIAENKKINPAEGVFAFTKKEREKQIDSKKSEIEKECQDLQEKIEELKKENEKLIQPKINAEAIHKNITTVRNEASNQIENKYVLKDYLIIDADGKKRGTMHINKNVYKSFAYTYENLCQVMTITPVLLMSKLYQGTWICDLGSLNFKYSNEKTRSIECDDMYFPEYVYSNHVCPSITRIFNVVPQLQPNTDTNDKFSYFEHTLHKLFKAETLEEYKKIISDAFFDKELQKELDIEYQLAMERRNIADALLNTETLEKTDISFNHDIYMN